MFLEDTELLAAKIQQSKLAGLGRLSASIAHEIRNPVGAMSHAAQLLGESASLSAEDKRLTEIVRTNGDRVRQIIENVMSMARRENSRPERLVLGSWLAGFRDEFCATMQIAPERLAISSLLGDVEVQVDPSQLRQIVWNLCENAVKYGTQEAGDDTIELRIGRLASTARPFLEVADRGPGIAAQHRETHLRALLHRQRARHRPGPVPGARAGADQRRHSSCMSRAPAAAACSASCFAIRNAGWPERART